MQVSRILSREANMVTARTGKAIEVRYKVPYHIKLSKDDTRFSYIEQNSLHNNLFATIFWASETTDRYGHKQKRFFYKTIL